MPPTEPKKLCVEDVRELRVTIVVEAEITPRIQGQREKLHTRLLGGKKFRVICVHLNPGTVIHMYAGELEDFRERVGVSIHQDCGSYIIFPVLDCDTVGPEWIDQEEVRRLLSKGLQAQLQPLLLLRATVELSGQLESQL